MKTTVNKPFNVSKQFDKTRNWFEKLADKISAWCGSWSFLLLHIIWFSWWFVAKYNINVLTMIVSLEAILLMAILLMTQNRAAKIDDLRDEADYQADISSERIVSEIKDMLAEIKKDIEELKKKK